jgi:hypothetical protein
MTGLMPRSSKSESKNPNFIKYSVMPIQWTFLHDKFQKYVNCTGIIFDFQGISLKISFFAESSIIMDIKPNHRSFRLKYFILARQKRVTRNFGDLLINSGDPPNIMKIYDQLSLIYQKRMLITLQLLINDPRLLFRQIRHS